MEIKDAMEEIKLMFINMFKLKVLKLGPTIHMPDNNKLAPIMLMMLPSNQTLIKSSLQIAPTNSKPLLLNNPLQLPLTLAQMLSNSTQLVFSMTPLIAEIL